MVTHHYRVLQEKEIAASSEFFDLGQGAGRRCGGSDWDQLWELEFVLFASVLAVLQVFVMDFTVRYEN